MGRGPSPRTTFGPRALMAVAPATPSRARNRRSRRPGTGGERTRRGGADTVEAAPPVAGEPRGPVRCEVFARRDHAVPAWVGSCAGVLLKWLREDPSLAISVLLATSIEVKAVHHEVISSGIPVRFIRDTDAEGWITCQDDLSCLQMREFLSFTPVTGQHKKARP